MTSNQPERINLSYQHPGMIDCDTPAEVRAIVLEQLLDVGPKLQELVEASTRQIRNAVFDEILEKAKADTPFPQKKDGEEPSEVRARYEAAVMDLGSKRLTAWENGDSRAALDRLHRLGGLLDKASRDIVELTQTGEKPSVQKLGSVQKVSK